MSCQLALTQSQIGACWAAGGSVEQLGGNINSTHFQCDHANTTQIEYISDSFGYNATCTSGSGKSSTRSLLLALLGGLLLLGAVAAQDTEIDSTTSSVLSELTTNAYVGKTVSFANSTFEILEIEPPKAKRQWFGGGACTPFYTFTKEVQVTAGGVWDSCDHGEGWYAVSRC